MNAPVRYTPRFTIGEFLAWAEKQPDGRWELVDGEIVAMAPERVLHIQVKGSVFRALEDAVRAAGLSCTVFMDGVGVATADATVRIPDASVQCGASADPDAMLIEPIIVVEVTSPTSVRTDEDDKLLEYFSVPSIEHYLVVHPKQRAVVHHSRQGSGEIRTRILRDGVIDLAPPGLSVAVDALLGPPPVARSSA